MNIFIIFLYTFSSLYFAFLKIFSAFNSKSYGMFTHVFAQSICCYGRFQNASERIKKYFQN